LGHLASLLAHPKVKLVNARRGRVDV